nr:hypothetical protein [Tanacetum cinerariifolium]
EEDQDLRLSEEARIQEEEDVDELYRNVNINQGMGLQVTQNVEDSHVTLTPVNPDGPQESSSMSSFMTSEAPIPPPTIPSIILENLPTLNSAFRFEERLRSLETSFSEYRQTNLFIDATDRLQDSLQQENDEFLRNIDENMKKIIKGQVKNQVKEQVSRILPRIKESMNVTLEAEVLTRSSHSSRTSYAIAADLSEMELKKILIEKMEGNKSIQRSDEQQNLYKALVEAYDADKAILDTYRDSTILKRRREDDDQEGPSARSNRGSKRQKEGEETVQTTCQMEEPPHSVFETGVDNQPIVQTSQHPECDLARQTDARSSFNELLDTPIDFSNFIMHRLNVDTLTPDLMAGRTYELMRGSCTSLTELEYHLEEPLPLIPDNRGHRVIPFEHFINNDLEYLRGGDFKRLRLQDIEDMLLLLVQGKLSNLTVKERLAFSVSLRMFTRSIVIKRRVEDLQLGVESYLKRLNLTKPDTYRPDLRRREAYTAHSNPRGFIYQNKDKKNRLMRIDELHKFSDETLNDIRNALDDRLKGI